MNSRKTIPTATVLDLARLTMEGHIYTLRFASDGETAVIKYYIATENGTSKRRLVEKRLAPTRGEDGINRYDISFLKLDGSY